MSSFFRSSLNSRVTVSRDEPIICAISSCVRLERILISRDPFSRPTVHESNNRANLPAEERARTNSWISHKLRRKNWFCGLSPDVLKSFSAASHLSTYPGGAILFVEGQSPRGAFVLCSGKVKLSTTSREGKVLILMPTEILCLTPERSAILTRHF